MKNTYPILYALLVLLFTAGCFQTNAEYTINPDGSGKVTFEVVCDIQKAIRPDNEILRKVIDESLLLSPEDKKTALDKLERSVDDDEDIKEIEQWLKGVNSSPTLQAEAILGLMKDCSGVDAWKDVSFSVKNSVVSFKGTAYFLDLNKFRTKYDLEELPLPLIKHSATAENKKRISVYISGLPETQGRSSTSTLSKEEIEKLRGDMRKLFVPMFQKMRKSWAGRKVEIKLNIAGKISSCENMEKDNNSVSLRYTGENVLDAMNRLTNNDKWLQGFLLGYWGLADKMLRKEVFGSEAIPSVTMTGATEPLFDYKKEVTEAKAAWPALLKKLGFDMSEAEEVSEGK